MSKQVVMEQVKKGLFGYKDTFKTEKKSEIKFENMDQSLCRFAVANKTQIDRALN